MKWQVSPRVKSLKTAVLWLTAYGAVLAALAAGGLLITLAGSGTRTAEAQGSAGARTPEPRAARSVVWERFDVTLDLLEDGSLQVIERQSLRFSGTYQQAFREISLDRLSDITGVEVGEVGLPYRSGPGGPGTFAVARTGKTLRVDWWYGPITDAARRSSCATGQRGRCASTSRAT